MAEKKAPTERKIVKASEDTRAKKSTQTAEATKTSGKGATGKRVGAIILWILGLGCEVGAILTLVKKILIPTSVDAFVKKDGLIYTLVNWLGENTPLAVIIAFLVLDLIFVIIGSQLWKKANHIDPPSKKNKFLFFLQSQLGAIVAVIAFVPFIIILLVSKEEDLAVKGAAKKWLAVGAIVGCLICGAASIDYHPASAEGKAAAEAAIDGDVFYSPSGHVYHTHEDCGHLANSSTLYQGSVDEAISAGRTRLCKRCAERDGLTNPDLELE